MDHRAAPSSASKPLKPFQGLKRIWYYFYSRPTCDASKPLKPFQGLKLATKGLKPTQLICFKASKTLSGIETLGFCLHQYYWLCIASKPLKPFQGLKLLLVSSLAAIKGASKPLKPFQGLKLCTYAPSAKFGRRYPSFKASKTLSGIETAKWIISK